MKIFLTSVLVLWCFIVYSERKTTLPYDTISKKIMVDTIVFVENKTKDQLHTLMNEWIAVNYRSANDVIQMNDKENGIIIAKGIFRKVIWSNFLGAGYDVPHTLTIKIKEGKIRVTIDNLFCSQIYDGRLMEFTLESFLISKPRLMGKELKTFESNIGIKLNETIVGISNFAKGDLKANDW